MDYEQRMNQNPCARTENYSKFSYSPLFPSTVSLFSATHFSLKKKKKTEKNKLIFLNGMNFNFLHERMNPGFES